MTNDVTILRDSAFSGTGVHGGFRRSMQIEHLITSAGLAVEETVPHSARWSRWQRVPAGIRFLLTHSYPIERSKTQIGHCGISVRRIEQSLREHRGAKVLIWEDASSPITPIIAREHGFRVVAVPHNIEALAGGHVVPASRLKPIDRLQTEIDWYKACDATFCIAREECWLLACADVNSHYLPYFPPPAVLDRLARIRERRQTTEKRDFVMLGTANNAPTAGGMIEVIRSLRTGVPLEGRIVIAGDGTEMLAKHVDGASKIQLLGRLSDDELDALLTQARALVVHQRKGAGALTRIPEALHAGIPVLANPIASRSAWDLPGVHHYDDLDHLKLLLNSDFEEAPMPRRPEDAERRFVRTILRLAAESGQ